MSSHFKIADHSNLDISIALCVSKYLELKIDNFHYKTLYAALVLINGGLFSPFLENDVDQKQLEKICVNLSNGLLEADKDLKKIACAIAVFFKCFTEYRPFKKGNHFTARRFIIALSDHLLEVGIATGSIDFRTVDADLYNNLTLSDMSEKLYEQLSVACSTDHSKEFINDEWPILPDASIEICGHKFLTYDNTYLVTQNGGLIEIDLAMFALEKFLKRGGCPADFTVERDAISTYLFNNDNPLSTLDGMPFGDEIPLVCLTVDYLTGLSLDKELPILGEILETHSISVLDLPDSNIKHPILTESVLKRISSLKSYIQIVIKRVFADAHPIKSGAPHFFLSMGGIGSGKSSLVKQANEIVKSNLVRLSMDTARATSKLYDFYIECGHHSDDYKSLALYASAIVAQATSIALKDRYNYFRDGTGIPYDKRYRELVALYKHAGFETHLLSAAAPLFVERDRKDMDKPVSKRIMMRYKKKQRLVPWNIIVQKHINHPKAFLESLQDQNIDTITLYDTMMKKGETKILAFKMKLTNEYYGHVREGYEISHSYCMNIMQKLITNKSILSAFKKANPKHFKLYTLGINAGMQNVLVILDKVKFIDLMQKASFYQDAVGYAGLVYNQFREHDPEVDYPEFSRSNDDEFRLRTQTIKNDAYLY
ncbi:MAG: zeta toxin family protein [Candidatus Jidaibacter sp.]|nr:zeta toxin family protein [Candidatus Jidaibacter sp.]